MMLASKPGHGEGREAAASPSDQGDSRRLGVAVIAALVAMLLVTQQAVQTDVWYDLERWFRLNRVLWRFVDRSMDLLICAAIALPLQIFLPAVRRKAKILTREFWIDLCVYWYGSTLLRVIGFYAVVNVVRGAIYGQNPAWLLFLGDLPFAVQVVLYLWAHDFVVYWRHRVEHTFGFFWAFHATHHTAERVDFVTTSRLHPGERFFGGILSGALGALAFEAEAASLGFAIYVYWNYFIHTNVRLRFPGFLKYVLVSPFMHQWHHATDEAAHNKNVGVVFAWNDWLFRSAHYPEHWPTEFGLGLGEQEEVGHNPIEHFLYPYRYWTRRYRNWRSGVPVLSGSS